MDSALVIPVTLPPRLERERRRHVAVAALSVPSHLTLLCPFVAPGDLTDHDRMRIASILKRHAGFDFQLGRIRAWPTALYLEVPPQASLVLDTAAPKGATHLRVSVRPEGQAPQILLDETQQPGRWQARRISLAAIAGKHVGAWEYPCCC